MVIGQMKGRIVIGARPRFCSCVRVDRGLINGAVLVPCCVPRVANCATRHRAVQPQEAQNHGVLDRSLGSEFQKLVAKTFSCGARRHFRRSTQTLSAVTCKTSSAV